MRKIALVIMISCVCNYLKAHDIDYGKIILKQWTLVKDNQTIEGSFYMYKNGEVYIEDAQQQLIHFPLAYFSLSDQDFVIKKYAAVEKINQSFQHNEASNSIVSVQPNYKLWMIAGFFFLMGAYLFFKAEKKKRKFLSPVFLLGIMMMLYGFTNDKFTLYITTTTSPAFVDSAFAPFKPKVYTHWDNTYFYVESKGIPDHQMMVGITKWQQQVPIPQCYTTANNNNAWSIPLNPVVAAIPVPVNQQHFLRGAIAIAVNGVAIFNPYTNTGVDALVDGQLDNFGGHCGRADDYHYHIAPLSLYGQTPLTSPIAFALDGFAVYGSKEPDGSNMTALDANHGHYELNGRYHYHGTAAAPYMIGNMVGQVTEDNTLQIIPQAAARPVRTSLQPLDGATIVNCQANANNNGYNLTYTIGSQNYQVNYNWADTTGGNSKYNFRFIAPASTVDSIYVGFSQSQCKVPTSNLPATDSTSKTMLRLPDTGENIGYTNTFGEDADYLINMPYFTANNNGTVKDTITGLLWQKTDGGEMTYENAILYCDTLTLGGYTDWRLPNPHEGFSILNQQYANPAIDVTVFTNTGADYWWTNTPQATDANKIWCTNAGGGIGNKPKTETISAGGTFKYHVRAVRDMSTPVVLPYHFTDNNDGTITDNITHLVWQKIPYTDSLTWENALSYAESLNLGNYIDWRLPNIKELQSINNEKKTNPSFDTSFFKITNDKKYWSSSTLPNRSTQAWFLNTKYGITSYDLKTARDGVICVRGTSSLSSSFIFNGNGDWDKTVNWFNYTIPPTTLTAGYSIIIDPIISGQCVLNTTQNINQGAIITVNAGKKFVIPGALIQQ